MKTFNQPTPSACKKVVIAGNSNISLGAYRSLEKRFRRQISNGRVVITVITESPFHTCYGLAQECVTGEIDYQNLLVPMTEMFPHAQIIHGKVTHKNSSLRKLTVEMTNGNSTLIEYDQFLEDQSCFSKSSCSKSSNEIYINSLEDLVDLRNRLTSFVNSASESQEKILASRHLRVAVAGKGLAGIELANSIAACMKQLCVEYGMPQLKPTVYLVLHNSELYEAAAFNSSLEGFIKEQLLDAGVRVSTGKQVIRVNTDGAVCNDGSFINCKLVVRTDQDAANGLAGLEGERPDLFGRTNENDCWKANHYFPGSLPEPASYLAVLRQGNWLGSNIARAMLGETLKEIKTGEGFKAGSMKRAEGFFRLGMLKLKGSLAYFLRTWLILRTLPLGNRRLCIRNMTDAFFLKQQTLEISEHYTQKLKGEFSFKSFAPVY